MLLVIIFPWAIVVALLVYIIYKRGFSNKTPELRSIFVSYSILSHKDAEDAFFDSDTRLILFYKELGKSDSFVSKFYLNYQLTEEAMNGYYCDGFFTIKVTDGDVEIKELK